MNLKYILVSLVLYAGISTAALPTGDTQGKVSAVRVLNTSSGGNSFRVYFTSTTSDRFLCIQTNGYITVRENGLSVSPESYKYMYSMALAALTSGKALALDSSASEPCENVNASMMVAN